MTNAVKSNETNVRKPFVKPELRVLDVKGTQGGVTNDPTEFDPFLMMS